MNKTLKEIGVGAGGGIGTVIGGLILYILDAFGAPPLDPFVAYGLGGFVGAWVTYKLMPPSDRTPPEPAS